MRETAKGNASDAALCLSFFNGEEEKDPGEPWLQNKYRNTRGNIQMQLVLECH